MLLVRAFHAQFSDKAGARIFGAVDLLQVLLIDRTDVADGVNTHLPQWVVPRQPRSNVHAGELVTMHREARHFLLVQRQLDRHAFVHLVQQNRAPDVADLLAAQQTDADQLSQRGIERLGVAHLFTDEFDVEGGHVVRQHHPVTVQDQPAAGRDGFGAYAVAQRETMEIVVLDDLQVEQASRDGQQQHGREHARYDAANRKQPVFGEIVFDPRLAAAYHRGPAVWVKYPGMRRL